MPRPSRPAQVPVPTDAELVQFIERIIGAQSPTSTMTVSDPVPSTTESQELAMRTQNRDAFCDHLDNLAVIAKRHAESLRSREPRAISASLLEATVNDIVSRVDAAFTVANPAMADMGAE